MKTTGETTVTVSQDVIDYAKKYGKKEAYLYNNRLLAFYINPSELRKQEYNINHEYIKSL